jgi:outer membrane protein OmpA-like peptidoglycan-associated protein
MTSFVFAGGIDAQRFKPSIGLKGMVVTDTSETLEPLDFGAFLYLHYDKDPFVSVDDSGNEDKILGNVFYGDALFTIAIIKNLEMGIVLPFSMYSSSDSSVTNVSKVSLGDIRLGLKYALPGMMIKNLGIGFTLNGYFPTGDPESFNSSDGVNIQPGFLLDYRFDKFLLAFNVSYMMKLSDAKMGNIEQNDEVGFRIGGKYSITDDFEAMLELFGAFQATNAFKLKEETPLELMLTANYYLGDIKFNAGGAIGLVSGVGTPLFRVIVGVGYVKREGDSDKDGLSDKNDKCPNKAEDKDGFEDTDGCPDLDNDKDGILDAQDKCPMDAEDIDKFEDEDGCPDLDNDNDGIADTDDKCPDVAETVNSFEDTDGCPDEVPILDADKDGIVDAQDKCPNDAEDKDGFEDEDGCPELDNDKDGILDAQDKCPLEAETVNGFEDEDGCPDKKPELVKINVETKKIEILEKVFFNTASSKINPNSYELLKKVATIINENKDIKKIVVEGHTDDLGNATTNKNLSQRRAQSVVEFLVKEKVSKKRLSAKGYGEEKPIVPVVGLIKKLKDKKIKKEEKEEIETKLDKNRSMNRRVEFTIIK